MSASSPNRTAQLADDLRACRKMLRGGSKSFFAASFLLPRDISARANALYSFCRLADDAVDESGGNPDAIALLSERVDRIYAGQPFDHPADRAFGAVALRFGLPRAVVDALIEGFAWDAAGRRYETISDLHAYGARVAGCVGVMMSTVMERCSRPVLSRAADLGVAMQLTNIARDVGEDARNGRIYLPLTWLREEGICPDAFLANPVFTPAIGRIVARLLAEADRLYTRADAGIDELPAACRPGIRAARLLYAGIGTQIAHNGYDSVTTRAWTSFSKKLPLLVKALTPDAGARAHLSRPPLAATAFLVDAAARRRIDPIFFLPEVAPWWNPVARFLPVIDMISRLERAERAGAFGTAAQRNRAS